MIFYIAASYQLITLILAIFRPYLAFIGLLGLFVAGGINSLQWFKTLHLPLIISIIVFFKLPSSSQDKEFKLSTLIYTFYAVIVLSLFFSTNIAISTEHLFNYTKYVVLYKMTSRAVQTKKQFDQILCALILFLSFSSISGIVEYLNSGDRASGFLGDPNDFSLTLISVIPCSIYFIITAKKKLLKFISLASVFCFLGGIIASHSRGAFLGLIVLVVFMLAGLVKFSKKTFLYFVVIAFFLVPFYSQLIPSTYIERMISIVEVRDRGVEVTSRGEIATGAIEMFKEKKIIGYGIGTFPYNYKQFFPDRPSYSAHNMYLEILVETGILGFIIFIIILLRVLLKLSWSLQKKFEETHLIQIWTIRSSLIGFMAPAFFLSISDNFILWILLGLSEAIFTKGFSTNALHYPTN